jgi:hypothetical protein
MTGDITGGITGNLYRLDETSPRGRFGGHQTMSLASMMGP